MRCRPTCRPKCGDFCGTSKSRPKKTAEEKRDADIKYETEMVEEIVKEGDIVPGTSYVNAELEMERMFFE